MFGSFVAFSGDGPDRNNADSAATADHGAIPAGRYYLIDRQSGGKLGWVRDLFRDHWFALYLSQAYFEEAQRRWLGWIGVEAADLSVREP